MEHLLELKKNCITCFENKELEHFNKGRNECKACYKIYSSE